MAALEHYETENATTKADVSVHKLARRLGDYAVGTVIVVDDERRPIGIVTDRDLLCRVVAAGLDPRQTTAGEVMSKPVATATSDEPLETVIGRMRATGVRRLPVVREGRVTGIVSIDDLVFRLGRELDDLGEAMRREVLHAREEARKSRKRREWRQDLEGRLADLGDQIERRGKEARELLTRELESLRERMKQLLDSRKPRS